MTVTNAASLTQRAVHQLKQLRRVFRDSEQGEAVNKHRVDAWQRELDAQLNKSATLPNTVIAVVGACTHLVYMLVVHVSLVVLSILSKWCRSCSIQTAIFYKHVLAHVHVVDASYMYV